MAKVWGSVQRPRCCYWPAAEQCPAAGWHHRIAEFENDEVRVWKAIVTPNAPLAMHRHEHPRVMVALDGGNMKIVQQTGGSEMNHWETGKAYWLPASKAGHDAHRCCSGPQAD